MADVGGIAGDRLKSFIERIERLEEEKAALASDIKDVFSEAKGTGFDTKVMRGHHPAPQVGPGRRRGAGDLARSLPSRAGHGVGHGHEE